MKERLRNIKEPKNVRLLFDVLHYQPLEIKRAVLFATNNALVCDTPEDAMKVAYEIEPHHRYDVCIPHEIMPMTMHLCFLFCGPFGVPCFLPCISFSAGCSPRWHILPKVWYHFWRFSRFGKKGQKVG